MRLATLPPGRGASRTGLRGTTRAVRSSADAGAASAARPARIIDVHHHLIPPFYLEAYGDRIAGSRGGEISPAWLSWSPEAAVAAMDANNVATSVLSLSTPGVWFGDPREACEIARRSNEYAAGLVQRYPGRFGLFASLPLPAIEGSLRELDYALDTLGADGIGLLTSYGDAWLGDPRYEPVFDELDRRGVVVFAHPTTPVSCRSLLPGIAPLIAEVPQDTTRAVINLLFTGSFSRFANIRFIFAHAGGTVPMVANRMHQYRPKNADELLPNGIAHELRRLFYDIAGTASPPAIAALTSLVPISQILFGSDNPYIPLSDTVEGVLGLGFSPAELRAIAYDNAARLLPRLGEL